MEKDKLFVLDVCGAYSQNDIDTLQLHLAPPSSWDKGCPDKYDVRSREQTFWLQ